MGGGLEDNIARGRDTHKHFETLQLHFEETYYRLSPLMYSVLVCLDAYFSICKDCESKCNKLETWILMTYIFTHIDNKCGVDLTPISK